MWTRLRIIGPLAALTFLAVALLVGEPLASWDRHVLTALVGAQGPEAPAAEFWRKLTFFGGPAFTLPATAALALLLVLRRLRAVAAALVATVAGASLLRLVLQWGLQRPRPTMVQALVHAGGYSFPSGHATASAAFYLALCSLLFHATRNVAVRSAAVATCTAVIALVGFSRVYLGVHYPSDVLAGWALAAFWTALVSLLLRRRCAKGPRSGAAAPGSEPGAD